MCVHPLYSAYAFLHVLYVRVYCGCVTTVHRTHTCTCPVQGGRGHKKKAAATSTGGGGGGGGGGGHKKKADATNAGGGGTRRRLLLPM